MTHNEAQRAYVLQRAQRRCPLGSDDPPTAKGRAAGLEGPHPTQRLGGLAQRVAAIDGRGELAASSSSRTKARLCGYRRPVRQGPLMPGERAEGRRIEDHVVALAGGVYSSCV